ncbi:hypothetical protein J2T02_002222 [Chitinophaga terrae (ex Kim and Jung 2007)]|jgi:hypothetical protein|uniref:hypothetical protein n=1 Tax=Chitinophaga terrae (ex Kim and Jung 2007) TaxID=408074 RepID=UPI00278518D6|nr:hypothetical protein [Chitinophaga terrae (ex Kim and Jung 2007)]MDQ0107105.1 hypothetical protein [Chitinophaga terrae (ex Kim and Jung 2007)]
MNLRIALTVISLAGLLVACKSKKTNELLMNKKWRVYDVQIPPESPISNTQYIQAEDLKRTYYKDAYYQFLDNNVFVATIAGKADTGKYYILSNGAMISVTAKNGDRRVENLVTITKLTEDNFDMKVTSTDFQFILCTKREK